MTKYLGVNCALAQPGPNKAPISGGDGGGNSREFYDEYVATGAENIGDTIQMGPPAGAFLKGDRVMDLVMNNDALTTANITVSAGTDDSSARFIALTAMSAAAQTAMTKQAAFGWQADADRPLLLTFAGANTPGVGAKIRVRWRVLRS